MQDRLKEYDTAKTYDGDRFVSRENKIRIWQQLLTALQSDNPYSSDDETMRNYVRERLDYWDRLRRERGA